MRLTVLLSLVVALTGCATQPYRETLQGKFTGVLDVRWVENDYFGKRVHANHLRLTFGQSPIRPFPGSCS
jgi:hypothetical protein